MPPEGIIDRPEDGFRTWTALLLGLSLRGTWILVSPHPTACFRLQLWVEYGCQRLRSLEISLALATANLSWDRGIAVCFCNIDNDRGLPGDSLPRGASGANLDQEGDEIALDSKSSS